MALYLLLELRQLSGELRNQRDGALQFLLQRSHLILLVIPLVAHQRHGSHSGEPLQVLFLRDEGEIGCERNREKDEVQNGGKIELSQNVKETAASAILPPSAPSRLRFRVC